MTNRLDLNSMPELKNSLVKKDTQISECWCYCFWKPGPIDVTFSVPKRKAYIFKTLCSNILCIFTQLKGGYVPGEQINFKVEIDNQSGEVLEHISVKLKQKAFLRASSSLVFKNQHTDKFTYELLKCPIKVKPYRSAAWEDTFTIPLDCPPTMTNMTDLIDMEYYFLLQLHKFSNPDSDLFIPIVIGMVPFRELLPSRITKSCVNTEV